jgi:hypothetical protein
MADPQAWGAEPVSTPADWGATEVDKPSGTADFFKSLPRGAIGGLSAGIATLPDLALNALTHSTAGPGFGRAVGLPGKEDIRGAIESVTGQLHKPETRAGRFGETVGEFAGNPLGYAGPGGPAAKVIGNVSAGVGSEAAGQAFAGGKKEQVARFLGAVGGGSFPALLRMLSPSVVAPERQKALDVLNREGIKPTVGQMTGSEAMRRAEGTLGTAVGAGGAGRREIDRIADEFTSAVARRMGATAKRVTPEVIEETRERLGESFERTARDLKIRADQKYHDDIMVWAQDLLKESLPTETTNRLIQQARNLAQGFLAGKPGEAAVMPGKNYQAHTRHDTPLARAIDDPDPNVGYYATRLRSILDDALERTATGRGTQEGKGMRKALAELQEARRQWYNMLVISRAVSGPGEGPAAGHISPQKLRQVLTSGDDKKIQYAAGRGDLSELSHAANEILAPIPTSQTAERALITSIPLGLGLGAERLASGDLPGAVALSAGPFAPGIAGRTLLSKPVQGTKRGDWQPDWLVNALSALPQAKEQTLRSLLLSQGQQNLPSYQEGGDAPAGQPIVVGERGPEVVVPKQDVEVVPDINSLLRMMGSGPVPPNPRDEMTPATANLAGRIWRGGRQAQPGAFAPYVQTTDELIQSAIQSAPMLVPGIGGMVQRGVAAAPKAATALLGAGGLLKNTSAAGEQPADFDPEPKRPADIQSSIDKINKGVDQQRKRLKQLGESLARGNIDKKEYDQRRAGPEADIIRAETDITKADAPFQAELKAWQQRKNDALVARQKAEEEIRARQAEAELPFRVKHPGATSAIVGGGQALTGGTALLAGLLSRGKYWPTLASMGLGGLEGAITSNIPEWLDIAGGQPVGSPAWRKTLEQQLSLENLAKTGAEAGVHASEAGAVGAIATQVPKAVKRVGEWPAKLREFFASAKAPAQPRPGSPPSPQPQIPGGPTPSPSPTGTQPGAPTAPGSPTSTPAPSGPPTVVRGGITYEHTNSGWRVQAGQKGGGRFMKKPPAWPSWLPRED